MLWLVISSLVIGLSHVPTGAAFAAIVIVSVPLRGGVATGEKGDLQISTMHSLQGPLHSSQVA